jgi:hypothetical protein
MQEIPGAGKISGDYRVDEPSCDASGGRGHDRSVAPAIGEVNRARPGRCMRWSD